MRIFIVFAIASIMLLPWINASPFFDKKFEQKFDNKRVWLDVKQQMEGDGQQHVAVHKRSIDDIVIPAAEDKMIEKDSQKAYAIDKVGNNGNKSKRDVQISSKVEVRYRCFKY